MVSCLKLISVAIIFTFSSLIFQAKAQGESASLVCYYEASSYWREGIGKFSAGEIDPSLCTHVLYSYMGISDRTNRLYSRDPGLDLGPGEIETDPDPPIPGQPDNNIGHEDMVRNTVQLRDGPDGNPDLKVLLSVGGQKQQSRTFSNMARHIANRTQFINSTRDFIEKYRLDGIDLDWRFPTEGDGRPEDKDNLVSVFKEIRAMLDLLSTRTGRAYLLTGTFSCKKETVENGYNLAELQKYLDAFHLLCFDMKMFSTESDESQKIGHHSPLYSKASDPSPDQQLTVDFGVGLFLGAGVASGKIVLGVSAYARTYEKDPAATNFYDRASGPGQPGKFTEQAGFLSYYEICWELAESLNDWQIRYDYDYQIPYGFNTTMWLGYDNEISVQEKVDFAINKRLGGMMIQFVDLDDCRNICQGWMACPITAAVKDRLAYHQRISSF